MMEIKIRKFMDDIIPSEAVSVSATLYDNRDANNSQGYVLLRITYIVDNFEMYVECYDTGSVLKVINQNSGRKMYENENNEHFQKYILRRNWFAWMQ